MSNFIGFFLCSFLRLLFFFCQCSCTVPYIFNHIFIRTHSSSTHVYFQQIISLPHPLSLSLSITRPSSLLAKIVRKDYSLLLLFISTYPHPHKKKYFKNLFPFAITCPLGGLAGATAPIRSMLLGACPLPQHLSRP